jgi:hypothetical protein
MPAPLLLNKFLGLNTSATYAELEPGELTVALNMRPWNLGRKLIQRRGQTPLTHGTFTQGGELQMLAWHQLGGTEYLVAVVSGSVVDGYTGNVLPGGANRFPGGADVNSCWSDFKVCAGDGVNPNVVLAVSGTTLRVSQLTCDPCDASGMVLTAGAAGNPNGTYSYAVKFVSALGVEGDILRYSGTATVSSTKILLTGIPLAPAGQDCSARHLYRIADGGAAYFLVASISDNLTTSYLDNLADSDLGPQMLNQSFPNSPLPPCRYWLAHAARVYAAGCFATTGPVTGSPNVLFVSDILDPTTARLSTDPTAVDQGGRFPLESPAAGTITGLADHGNMPIVFTGGSLHVFTGSQPSDFRLDPLSAHGCCAHRSICSTQEELFWLASDGVWSWRIEGYVEFAATQRSYVRVSEKIRDRIDAIPASGLAKASGVYSDSRYWLATPDQNLVYDLPLDAWYEDDGNTWTQLAASVFTSDSRPRIYGAKRGTAQVWQLDTGTTDNGSAIGCRVQTADLDAGLPGRFKTATHVGGLFRACAETLSGSLIRNAGETIHTWTIPLVSGSVWQVVPGNNNVSRMRQRPPVEAKTEWFRLLFACDSTGGKFELLSGMIELKEPVDQGGVNGE